MDKSAELRIILGTFKSYTVKDLEDVRTTLYLSNGDMAILLDISESSYYRLKKRENELLTLGQSVIVDHLKAHLVDPEIFLEP